MLTKDQEQNLASLRQRIGAYIGERRLSHTLAVEREITALSELFAPEEEYTLRVSALLHDITKELSMENQLQLCDEFGIIYTEAEKLTPKIFHSRTAGAVIHRDMPEFSGDDICLPIRWHTTGHDGMTLNESLLFLADYIEDTRTFESCVELRKFFYGGITEDQDMPSRLEHLIDTMILAFDMTIKELLADAAPIHTDTVAARNYFICKKQGRL